MNANAKESDQVAEEMRALRQAHRRLQSTHVERAKIEGAQRENAAWALEAAHDDYVYRQDELHVATTSAAATAARRGAEAAERQARGLNRATWVLAVATIVLAVATIVLTSVTAQATSESEPTRNETQRVADPEDA